MRLKWLIFLVLVMLIVAAVLYCLCKRSRRTIPEQEQVQQNKEQDLPTYDQAVNMT